MLEHLARWWDPERVAAWTEQAERLGPIAWERGGGAVSRQMDAATGPPPEPLPSLGEERDLVTAFHAGFPVVEPDAAGQPWAALLDASPAAISGGPVPVLEGHGGRQAGVFESATWGPQGELSGWIRWRRFTAPHQQALRTGQVGLSIGFSMVRPAEVQHRAALVRHWKLREVSLAPEPLCPGTGILSFDHIPSPGVRREGIANSPVTHPLLYKR